MLALDPSIFSSKDERDAGGSAPKCWLMSPRGFRAEISRKSARSYRSELATPTCVDAVAADCPASRNRLQHLARDCRIVTMMSRKLPLIVVLLFGAFQYGFAQGSRADELKQARASLRLIASWVARQMPSRE